MTDDMPRAKRLKMLREAKERKERIERGEDVEAIDAGVQSVAIEPAGTADAHAASDSEDKVSRAIGDEQAESVIVAAKTQEVSSAAAEPVPDNSNEDDEDETELLNLAPKRANWDIERDIAPMLKKLEKRTQYAIAEILREKLAAEQAEDDDEEEDDEEEQEDEETEQVQ